VAVGKYKFGRATNFTTPHNIFDLNKQTMPNQI